MIILKKKSPEVEAMRRTKANQDSVTLSRQELYFSKSFTVANRIKEGQYVSFLNDGDDWRFYVSNDKDGFLLKPLNRGRQGLYIQDGAIVNLIRRTILMPAGKLKFPIQKTMTKQENNIVYWILTKKRIL